MSEYEELDTRLRAWLAEDELWALEASRFSAENNPERGWAVPEQIPGGMHWRWGYGENWDTFTPDVSISPVLNEVPEPNEWHHVTLASVETWEWRLESGTVSQMPERIIGDSDRIPTAAAGHIIRHDPARVLADIAGRRALLDHVAGWPHVLADGDTWFSCSQAESPFVSDDFFGGPGSGCADEKRKGKPCDCGLDGRRLAVLRCVAAGYVERAGFKDSWRIGD